MSRDGGLYKSFFDHLISLKSSTIDGFGSLGRDFTPEKDLSLGPRLVAKTGSNRKILRTNKTEIRSIFITLEVWGKSDEVVKAQAGKVDGVLNALAENPRAISAAMPEGSYVRDMTIEDQQSSQVQPGQWKTVFTTEWEIGISRAN